MGRKLIKDVRKEERLRARQSRYALESKLQSRIYSLLKDIRDLKVEIKDLKRENEELVEYADLFSNCHCDKDGNCQYMSEDDYQ